MSRPEGVLMNPMDCLAPSMSSNAFVLERLVEHYLERAYPVAQSVSRGRRGVFLGAVGHVRDRCAQRGIRHCHAVPGVGIVLYLRVLNRTTIALVHASSGCGTHGTVIAFWKPLWARQARRPAAAALRLGARVMPPMAMPDAAACCGTAHAPPRHSQPFPPHASTGRPHCPGLRLPDKLAPWRVP